jgi:hypothetical protein
VSEAGGQWLALSELAKLERVAVAAISRKVSKLETRGELKPRLDGRKKLVNVAEFRRAVARTSDLAKAHRAGDDDDGPPAQLPLDEKINYADEQARYRKLQADLAQVQLDELLGRLIQVEKVKAAAQRCIEPILRQWDQIIARAEDGAIAVSRDGTRGLRFWLKEERRKYQERATREFQSLAADHSDLE